VWVTCAALYAALLGPNLAALRAGAAGGAPQGWAATAARTGIVLQAVGMAAEVAADAQMCAFKSVPGNRSRRCDRGLWAVSTQPNYAGEVIFWVGNFLGGLRGLDFLRTISLIGLAGILAVLRFAAGSKAARQADRYGDDAEAVEFWMTHGMFGPNISHIVRRRKMEDPDGWE